ncbi:MAG: phosphotransferase family protein [Ilumatobacteraceae bacterium]
MRGIEEPNVSNWLAAHVEGAVAPFEYHLIAGGRSNLTYRVVDAAGTVYVLRRPPLGHVLATAHDMAREHKLMAAVGKTPVPVPRMLALCEDPAVNGAPFYVMSYVAGTVMDSLDKAASLPVELRRTAAFDLIDVLAELHAADIDAIGLGDLARREGYIERQLKRWTTQWQNSKTRELAAMDEVVAALTSRVPEQKDVAIVHGDYRFGNVLTNTETGRIAAVLDWELCTLGDPLADVGYLGIYWARDDQRLVSNDPSAAPGFPSYDELVARYAERTGRDVSQIEYYVAFSYWRLAVISEGVYARYLNGAMGEQDIDLTVMKGSVEHLVASALAAVRRLG